MAPWPWLAMMMRTALPWTATKTAPQNSLCVSRRDCLARPLMLAAGSVGGLLPSRLHL